MSMVAVVVVVVVGDFAVRSWGSQKKIVLGVQDFIRARTQSHDPE